MYQNLKECRITNQTVENMGEKNYRHLQNGKGKAQKLKSDMRSNIQECMPLRWM